VGVATLVAGVSGTAGLCMLCLVRLRPSGCLFKSAAEPSLPTSLASVDDNLELLRDGNGVAVAGNNNNNELVHSSIQAECYF